MYREHPQLRRDERATDVKIAFVGIIPYLAVISHGASSRSPSQSMNLSTVVRRSDSGLSGWAEQLVSRCQELAGRTPYRADASTFRVLHALIEVIPDRISGREQLLVRTLLPYTLARLAQYIGLQNHPTLGRRFLDLGATPWGRDWSVRWRDTITAFELAAGMGAAHSDRRVRRILDVIDARFMETDLALPDVARAVNLSPRHVAKLLRAATGVGFVGHLHRCRVATAEGLLVNSALSLKEIAAAVGYSNQSHFCRQFRTLTGTNPKDFRARRSDCAS